MDLGNLPGRVTRWFRYTVRPPELVIVQHPDYSGAAAGPLMDPARAEKILAFLTHERIVRRPDISRPIPASLENVLRVHTREYIESLSDPAVVGGVLGLPLGGAETQQAVDLARLMVGGTIQASRLALQTGRVSAHLGGGFHHATPEEGMGFCLINDVAIAIARLRAKRFHEPVLVVDLDLHDGNGTRAVFAEDPTVYTYSVHNVPWDHATAVASTAIALGSGVTDDLLLETLQRTLPAVVEEHRPGLVFYVAGVDGAETDALGDWKLTPAGMLARDRFVVELLRNESRRIPLVVVLAGGYGPSAWRYSARFLGWIGSGAELEPPDDAEMVLQRFREISRSWDVERAVAEDENDWGLTEEDFLGLVSHQDTRFLSVLSRHAVELQLEELGILDRIRSRGFRQPVLSLDAPRGLNQVLRLHGDSERTQLLMELKATRSRRIVQGLEVIEVDWLKLQNPRAEFTPTRPQLPGQDYPGLGILRDVAGWLVVVCETLRLDGIAFVPSQYYMAAVGYHHLRFLDPATQGRFEALRDALRPLGIARANLALAAGAVIDDTTGEPFSWQPAVTVLPVSAGLRECVSNAHYRAEVEQVRATTRFCLREVSGGGR
jgi:acetoin utilization deacetylase AcuC-like enzyme